MVKNVYTLRIIASLFLFVHPCYSMFCCGCDDEEEETLIEEYIQFLSPPNIQEQKIGLRSVDGLQVVYIDEKI